VPMRNLMEISPSGATNQTQLFLDFVRTQQRLSDIEDYLQQAGIIKDTGAMLVAGHALDNELKTVLAPMDMAWVIGCATLVFLMQLGFAQLEAGMCRPKNVITTYVKNIADFMLGTMAALVIGFAIAYGQVPLFETIEAWKFFFHLVFQATASTIVSGAMAERINIRGYMAITLFLAAFVYSTAVALTWGGGYLSQLDPPFHDFAGSGVVHLLGGTSALAGTIVLGSRLNRWEKPELFVCHSIPQVLSGVLLLWVGWYGFNPGSTGAMSSTQDALYASNAAMTTSISPAAAGTFIIIYDLYMTEGEHINVLKFANCVLGGLVAITAGCNVLSPWASIVIGIGSTGAYIYGSALIKKFKIDDVVDAAAVHACCGAWGCIAVGLFHPEQGLLTVGSPYLLGSQIISVTVLASLGFFPIYGVCWVLNKRDVLRASEEEERMGIDLYLFTAQAYVSLYDPDDDPFNDIQAGGPLDQTKESPQVTPRGGGESHMV